MSFEFQDLTLGSLCEVVTKGTTPTTVGHKFQTYGVNFVKSESILFDGRIDSSKFAFIDEAAHASLKRSQLQEGDILFSMAGVYIGKTAVVSKSILPANTNQAVGIVRLDKKKAIPEYINYYLRNPIYNRFLNNLVSQSAQPNLNLTEIRNLPISLPSIVEQQEIADILVSLDNRISLLRETNITLEAIAQTLFKSWFVDFDPVKAKAEGRLPEGMDETTAALFPSEFEESALGLIPKGWRLGMLGDIARLHKGSINPLHHQNTVFEHYSLPSFDNGQSPVMEAGIEIKSNKTSVPKNAVLLSKLNPHIPRVWLPSKIGDNAVCSTEFLVYVPADGASKEQVYCTFIAGSFQSSLLQLVTGTSNSHQRVKPDTVSALPMVIPSSDIQKVFEAVAKPLFARVGHNRQKAQTLTTLRNTLLPRLISGQLRLNQTQEIMDEVGA